MAVAEPTPALERPAWPAVLHDWVTTVDHKKIGLLYILMALLFLVVAGVEALVMRVQLLWPGFQAVPPDVFNQMFTMHGTTMVFFAGMPILAGVANYVVPLQLGARDMALPRLNALGPWVTFLAGCSPTTASPPAAPPPSAGSPTPRSPNAPSPAATPSICGRSA
jgi:cytochrome c oxidase subunit 1